MWHRATGVYNDLGSQSSTMYYKQLVQFLQLAILNFQPELLVLIGDVRGSEILVHIQSRLRTTLPAVVLTSSDNASDFSTTIKCPSCPTNRLTIISGSESEIFAFPIMISSKITNRVVFVRTSQTTPTELARYLKKFIVFNMVLAEIDEMGNLEVLAWGNKKAVLYGVEGSTVVSRFKGPEAIFLSQNDSNALVFRNMLNSWPRSGSTAATFLTIMTAPSNFIVIDPSTGRYLLASSCLTLIHIIGNILHFSQKIKFVNTNNCQTCFDALPLAKNTGPVQLFPYEFDVLRKMENSAKSDIVILHYMKASNDNKMFAIRRYVAIVPYRTGAQDGSSIVLNSLLNAAVLMFWLCGAVIFTVVRIPMHTLVPAISVRELDTGYDPGLTKFFSCLAGVLGNSFGRSVKCVCKAESFLMFVIGVFATLTSMLFTGAIFEQLVAIDPPPQIDTLQELYASNLKIIECWGDLQMESLYLGHNKSTDTLSVLEIERALLEHNTQYAFVLPESIADILDYPEMKYSNGTPVYHLVAETYSNEIMPHFLVFAPYPMQKRFFLFWNRLVESGIDTHVNKLHQDLYKTIRFKWSRSFIRNELVSDPSKIADFGVELTLYMLVLGFGYTMAGISFVIELFYGKTIVHGPGLF